MLQGAIIGIIVALVLMMIRKNKENKALAKVTDDDLIDQPDFAAFFHCASEATFNKKGLKFFDTNGAITLNGSTLNYQPSQKGVKGFTVDINNDNITLAPEKRKMKWIEINVDANKYYVTSFKQGAFSIDKSKMEEFLNYLRGLDIDL